MEVFGFVIVGVVGVAIGGCVGFGIARGRAREEADKLRREIAELKGQLKQVGNAEKLLDTAKTELRDAFDATARKALQDNRDEFLGLANENLGKQLERAKGEFEKRHGEFQELVRPLTEDCGKLSPQIESLTTQMAKLSGALTNNRQVGHWGEVQLRRVVEIAGMVSYCDFVEQSTTGQSRSRPDMLIRLPNNRTIVVDAKASLAAYLASQKATDAGMASKALERHAAALKRQVDELAGRSYGVDVTQALDFVVMFVPGDQFLGAALEAKPDLIEYGMEKGVAIATPASLIALLWTIHNGWHQYSIAENATKIHDAGKELYKRICKYKEHNGNVGKGLSDAVKAYNRSVGSFERLVVPKGTHFAELTSEDDFQPMQIVEDSVRTSSSAEAFPPKGAGPSERSTPASVKRLIPPDLPLFSDP